MTTLLTILFLCAILSGTALGYSLALGLFTLCLVRTWIEWQDFNYEADQAEKRRSHHV